MTATDRLISKHFGIVQKGEGIHRFSVVLLEHLHVHGALRLGMLAP